jgi:Glyoxalase-like domain
MATLPALRQVVLLAGDLSGALDRTKALLGLRSGIRDESSMAALGFEHEVLAIRDTFIEIVSPLSPDSSPGRLLARQGDSGYMVALQVADVDAVVERGSGLGIKPVMNELFEGNRITQWHPRDLGTLAEIDEMRVAEWHFCPALSDTGCTDVVADIVGADIAVPDPTEYAGRWATLLGIDLDPGATRLRLGRGELRFVPDSAGSGLRAVRLAASAPDLVGRGGTRCGVSFSIVTGDGADQAAAAGS